MHRDSSHCVAIRRNSFHEQWLGGMEWNENSVRGQGFSTKRHLPYTKPAEGAARNLRSPNPLAAGSQKEFRTPMRSPGEAHLAGRHSSRAREQGTTAALPLLCVAAAPVDARLLALAAELPVPSLDRTRPRAVVSWAPPAWPMKGPGPASFPVAKRPPHFEGRHWCRHWCQIIFSFSRGKNHLRRGVNTKVPGTNGA
jgi:hypothetical protein